jgi:hypothetical protein
VGDTIKAGEYRKPPIMVRLISGKKMFLYQPTTRALISEEAKHFKSYRVLIGIRTGTLRLEILMGVGFPLSLKKLSQSPASTQHSQIGLPEADARTLLLQFFLLQ